MGRHETLTSQSLVERSRRQDPHRPVAQLFVVLRCDDPLGSPSRHLLDGVDIVQLRRGTAAHARRETAGTVETLILEIPDPRMSQEHARLVAVRGGWVVEDAGSKNGTGVNGVVTTHAQLGDGDILEVGHTFLMFRDAVPAVCPDMPDLLADDLDERTAGPATFVAALREQLEALARVAPTAVPVTFLGETGTGKEVAARALHALSRRRGKLVAVNCGALPETLLEAELFGHRRGAFSGAVEDRLGLVRAAHHGTLLLDEMGELPAGSQVAFLRVLQEQEVVPVGGAEAVKVDVRLCVATNADLEALVTKGAFREDLYARLGGLVVRLPPLRDRREDLGLLIGAILRRGGATRKARFSPAAARRLFWYGWPRNVRELERCIDTAEALAANAPIDVVHLPDGPRAARPPHEMVAAELTVEERQQRDQLAALLEEHDGNVAAVARAMGKARTQVHRWIRRFGLRVAEFR